MAEKIDDIIAQTEDLKKEAAEYRAQFETKWREQERFYYGLQWKYNEQRPVKNHIFSIVETEIPILTDSMPGASFLPNEEENTQDAEMLESSVKWTEQQQEVLLKDPLSVRSQLITGNGWQYIDYDHDAEDGEGACQIHNINWRLVYIDPAANDLDSANYAVVELPMRVADAQRKWPEKKKLIEPISDKQEFENSVQEFLDPEKWNPPDASLDATRSRYSGKDMTFMTHIFMRDYTMIRVPDEITQPEILKEADQFIQGINPDISKYEDHEAHYNEHDAFKRQWAAQALQVSPEELTDDDIELLKGASEEVGLVIQIIEDHKEMHKVLHEKNPKGQMPKYENFWRLVVKNQDRLIYDGEPDVDDGMIPLVPFYDYKTEDSPYAVGAVRNLVDAQKSYNEMDWAEYESLMLVSNPGWVIDEESGVDETTLTNERGIIIKKKVGTEASRLDAGQSNPQLTERKQNDYLEMQSIEGVNDATQGKSPSDDPSGVAIRRLQQQSIGRIRLKTRCYERYTVKRRNKLIASRNVKFWSTERKLRLYDESGQIKFVDFSPERIRDLKYEVTIVPGSIAGVDKEQIYAMMERLLTAGIIDKKMFFKSVDVPNKVAILESIEESDEVMQQLQQVSQQVEQQAAEIERINKQNEKLEKQLDIAPEISQRDEVIELLTEENNQLKQIIQPPEEQPV